MMLKDKGFDILFVSFSTNPIEKTKQANGSANVGTMLGTTHLALQMALQVEHFQMQTSSAIKTWYTRK